MLHTRRRAGSFEHNSQFCARDSVLSKEVAAETSASHDFRTENAGENPSVERSVAGGNESDAGFRRIGPDEVRGPRKHPARLRARQPETELCFAHCGREDQGGGEAHHQTGEPYANFAL